MTPPPKTTAPARAAPVHASGANPLGLPPQASARAGSAPRTSAPVTTPKATAAPSARIDRELLKGTGEMAVLSLLAGGDMYGYQLARELQNRSAGVLAMGHGTLYPLLYNLEAKGLIVGELRPSDDGPDRKYYAVTEAGRARLVQSTAQWVRLVEAMAGLLEGAERLVGGGANSPREDSHPPFPPTLTPAGPS